MLVHFLFGSFEIELHFEQVFHFDLVRIVDDKLVIVESVTFRVGDSRVLSLAPGYHYTIRPKNIYKCRHILCLFI